MRQRLSVRPLGMLAELAQQPIVGVFEDMVGDAIVEKRVKARGYSTVSVGDLEQTPAAARRVRSAAMPSLRMLKTKVAGFAEYRNGTAVLERGVLLRIGLAAGVVAARDDLRRAIFCRRNIRERKLKADDEVGHGHPGIETRNLRREREIDAIVGMPVRNRLARTVVNDAVSDQMAGRIHDCFSQADQRLPYEQVAEDPLSLE